MQHVNGQYKVEQICSCSNSNSLLNKPLIRITWKQSVLSTCNHYFHYISSLKHSYPSLYSNSYSNKHIQRKSLQFLLRVLVERILDPRTIKNSTTTLHHLLHLYLSSGRPSKCSANIPTHADSP